MSGKYKSITILILFILIISGCSSVIESEATSDASDVVQDELLLFIHDKDEEYTGSLYTLDEEQNRVRVATNVLEGHFWIVPNSGLILYLDEEKELFLYKDQNTTNTVATEVDGFSVEISADGSTIAYLREDVFDLYIQNIGGEQVEDRQRIATDVSYYNFDLSSDGSFLYYLDDGGRLVVKEEGESDVEIAQSVIDYRISAQNQYVFYENTQNDFYVHTFEDSENRRIEASDVFDIQLTADETMLLMLTDFNFETDRGELFSLDLEDHTLNWIASDVKQFSTDPAGNHVYYLNDSEQFMLKSLTDDQNTTIASDVTSFQVSPDSEQVIYTDELNNLYLKNRGDDAPDELSNDILSSYITNDTVYILNSAHTLSSIDDENNLVEIAKDVKDITMSPNESVLAFVTDEDKLFLKIGSSDAVEKLGDVNDYSQIYLYDYLLYHNLLSIDDIAGYWEFSNGMLFEVATDGEWTIHEFGDFEKYEIISDVSVEGDTHSTGTFYFDDNSRSDYVEWNGSDELIFESDSAKATRISREELTNKLAVLEEEMDERIVAFEEEERIAQEEEEARLAQEEEERKEREEAALKYEEADSLGYYFSYEYIVLPAGTPFYEYANTEAVALGETEEVLDIYVYDFIVDEQYNVWLEVNGTYDQLWILADEDWEITSTTY
ncbi:hypothetical protein [Salipaludibacillus daqingensis]|uniref:hypothetical protein n=1 Tax=Salipaludibacillus daqingensis TaxID=3041001 RepID=UPI00247306AE|nr:hypothetical protein [Salipaludibacillus daqingensis]